MAGGVGPHALDAVITVPLPVVARLERFDSFERLSELFMISATVICDDFVDFFPALGLECTIEVFKNGDSERFFNGALFAVECVGGSYPGGVRYNLVLKPWLHFLTRNLDYVIFQDKTVVDIVGSVFASRGRTDVDMTLLSGNFSLRPYCVQYRESDFDFISRLMEEEGIYYFFRHEQNRHVMVLCNGRNSHVEPDSAVLPYIPTNTWNGRQDCFWTWRERIGTGAEKAITFRNFDFEQPAKHLEGRHAADEAPGNMSEVFDYPAPFLQDEDGEALAEVLMQSLQSEQRYYSGDGSSLALCCGDLMTLTSHFEARFNQDYLVVSLRFGMGGLSYRSGDKSGISSSLIADTTPADTPWRAAIVHRRPVARGPETATVTGPDGETIYTDEYGRVKVRFNWDRSNSDPDQSTCFVRVAQSSAGNGFGFVNLPRIGQEVIVDFLHGDPDRPIITGRVYNANRMTWHDLPVDRTISSWSTQTIGQSGPYDGAEDPPGDKRGYNSILMDDRGGAELIGLHAQRNYDAWVRLDKTEKVGRDRSLRVGRNDSTAVGANRSAAVGAQDKTVVTGNQLNWVKKVRSTRVQDNDFLRIFQGDQITEVEQGNVKTTVDQGNVEIDVTSGSVKINAGQQITLQVGDSSIVIDTLGVTIKGSMVSVQAEVSLDLQGSSTSLKGDIVNIN